MKDNQHDTSEPFGIAEYLDGKFSKEHIYSEQDVIYIVNIATAKTQAEIEELKFQLEGFKSQYFTDESRIAELEQLNEKLKQNMKKVSEGTTHIVENKDNKIKKLNSRIKELEQTAVDDATMYRETLDKIKDSLKCCGNCGNDDPDITGNGCIYFGNCSIEMKIEVRDKYASCWKQKTDT